MNMQQVSIRLPGKSPRVRLIGLIGAPCIPLLQELAVLQRREATTLRLV